MPAITAPRTGGRFDHALVLYLGRHFNRFLADAGPDGAEMNGRAYMFGVFALFLAPFVMAQSYDVRHYEESAGLSVAGFYGESGDIYGGGFESGAWLTGTPVFGELFGHWFSHKKEAGNYYAVGMSLRILPRWTVAPFAGGGAAYNRLLSEQAVDQRADPARSPESSYWTAFADAGLRIWINDQRTFLEGTYRYHWSNLDTHKTYGWISLEFGQRF